MHGVPDLRDFGDEGAFECDPARAGITEPAVFKMFERFAIFQCIEHDERFDCMRIAATFAFAEYLGHTHASCGESRCTFPFSAGADHRFAQTIPLFEHFAPAAAKVAFYVKMKSTQMHLVGEAIFHMPMHFAAAL